MIKIKPNGVHRTKSNECFLSRIYGLMFVKKMEVFPPEKKMLLLVGTTYTLFVRLQRVSVLRSAMKEFRVIKVEISKFHLCYETNISLMKQQFVVTQTIPQNDISALSDILVANTPCGVTAFSQKKKKLLPINFHKFRLFKIPT